MEKICKRKGGGASARFLRIRKSASIAEKQVRCLCCPAAVRGARLGKKATGKTGKAQDPRDEPSQKARV